jgi:ribosomal protein S8
MQRFCEMITSLLKTEVQVQRAPYHPLNIHALNLLVREGLVRGYVVEGNRVNILLKHYLGAPVIQNIQVVSRPSREIFLSPHEMKRRTSFNSGLWLIHNSLGVMTHRECIELGLSGRVLAGVNVGSQKWV